MLTKTLRDLHPCESMGMRYCLLLPFLIYNRRVSVTDWYLCVRAFYTWGIWIGGGGWESCFWIIQWLSAIQACVMPGMVLHCWKSKHWLHWGLAPCTVLVLGSRTLSSVLHLWEWNDSSCGVSPSLGANSWFLLKWGPVQVQGSLSFLTLLNLDAISWMRNQYLLPPQLTVRGDIRVSNIHCPKNPN